MICLCGQTNSAQEGKDQSSCAIFKTNTGAAHVQYRSGALFLKKGCGEQYPYGEDIFYTASVPAESQPRFGPPGSGLGTPSPGFGPGSDPWLRLRSVAPASAGRWALAVTVLVRGGAPLIFPVLLGPSPIRDCSGENLWIIHGIMHKRCLDA